MSKGPTKAQRALAEAREWIEASKEEIREREAALAQAHNQLEMHETIYAVLEKTLTRQVAQKQPAKKSATRTAGKSLAAPARRRSSANGGVPAQVNDTQRTVSSSESENGETGSGVRSTSANIETGSDAAHVAAGGSSE